MTVKKGSAMKALLLIPAVALLSACSALEGYVHTAEGVAAEVYAIRAMVHCKRDLNDRINLEAEVNKAISGQDSNSTVLYIRPDCDGDTSTPE